MIKILNEEHKGYGGMYFLCINYVCAVIMTMCLQLSWYSQAVSIADNIAYIAASNTLVHSYLGQYNDYDKINPTLNTKTATYQTLKDFNNMMQSTGITNGGASKCRVIYDSNKHKVRVQFGELKTKLNTFILFNDNTVTPHEQDCIVEVR